MPLHTLNRRQHALEDELRQRLRHHHGTREDGVSQQNSVLEPDPVPGGSASGLANTLADALGASALVEYIECGGMLHAVVVRGSGHPHGGDSEGGTGSGALRGQARARRTSLRALGPVEPLLAELDSLRFAWRRLLTGHGSPASLDAAERLATYAAGQLDRALLAPLSPLLAGRSLVVVPPGSLHSLPWPMLPSCVGRPVTVAPSAATWLAARPDDASSTSPVPGPPIPGTGYRTVLVAGPGLSQSAAEVDSLTAIYPGAQVLTGPDATIAATLRALDGADIAHIAAHGRFRADNPMFSSVVLADGPLTVYDLERLRHAPKTIMLAVCDSALTSAHAGDEMIGLASALLAVGAGSVVAPLLPLPDEVAARLAHGWHARLGAGHSPAEALSAMATATAQDSPLHRLAGSTLVCLGHGGYRSPVARSATGLR
jgi:hypothetical protein